MRQRSRNDEEKQERREAILDAAEEAFIQQRFDKTSMDSIARSAGLSRGLLYVYFHDKEDIHLALCVRAAESLLHRMQRYTEDLVTGLDKLRQLGHAYLDYYQQERDYFRILTLSSGLGSAKHCSTSSPTPSKQEYADVEGKIMALMADSVRQAMAEGSVQVEDALSCAMFLRGSLHGLIMLQDVGGSGLFDAKPLDREAWLTSCMDRLIQSLVV